ncbi:hypothetical protein L1887_28802 [Cichorium endivia]|nr:hypothetical protein L1887_28802 [Cichorium endivia]
MAAISSDFSDLGHRHSTVSSSAFKRSHRLLWSSPNFGFSYFVASLVSPQPSFDFPLRKLISTLPGTKFSIGGQWRTPFAESSATEHWKVSRYRQIIPHLKVAVICKTNLQKGIVPKATSFSVKCQQSSKDGNSLDVWLGRTVMIGFAAAISVEISTGKGLLENFGLTSPLPTMALAVTALVGVLTAIFIFQSASEN